MPLCFCSCFAGSPVLLQDELIFESLETVECWLGPFPSLSPFWESSKCMKCIERYHPLVSSTFAPETWGYDYTPNQARHDLSELGPVRFISAGHVTPSKFTTTNGKHDFYTLYQNSLSHWRNLPEGFCSALPNGMLWALCSTEPGDWQRIPATSSPLVETAVGNKSLEVGMSIR